MADPAVRLSFDRAATSYDSAARLQRLTCELLLDRLADPSPPTVLDAGCGTGYGKALLSARWPEARILAADFAPAMLRQAGGGVCADIQALPFGPASFDLYWSSLTVQWCDPTRTMAEAFRTLAPDGRLAVSSLAPGTLGELTEAFGSDGNRHVLEFSPATALTEACASAGFAEISTTQTRVRLHHPDLHSLLRELKALGANQVGGRRRSGLLGRDAWGQIQARYERLRVAAGLPATFEVILCTARKAI